ncbi:uncharacterized protein LOC129319574 [Prosopis cineraria]|uniref:uncharacterized protein LOC129319574 n=1 Tax=Prosopis cineraria TaxID=364024 RepID=UPI00240F94BA|nr:uncharacterized protein LOC129319574 [Prosopis cineraria]
MESCLSSPDSNKSAYETNYCLEELPDAIEGELKNFPKKLEKLKTDVETPLYEGCTEFTLLSAMLELYNLKATSRNEYEELTYCPKCEASRYKQNGKSPKKAMLYFPIIPRFRRLYSIREEVKNLTWHARGRIKDNKVRHSADSSKWIRFDRKYPGFSKEERNLRLVLSTDGMNPYGMQSNTHSTWPVMMVIYNLPPWLCMKRKYIMLSLLISGSKQPDNDIDVYLEPLIEDLKLLWEIGIEVYDAYKEEIFNLRAMLFSTINDFPAYEGTHSVRLQHGIKNVYLGHRKWLSDKYRYRRWKKSFNRTSKEGRPPKELTGEELFEKVKDIDIQFSKPFAKHVGTSGWKKMSIFFELPYWKTLNVRHFLDLMHIKKNVCDSLVGTLLNIPGKTKDGINARLDMVVMGIREELTLQEKKTHQFLYAATYTLSKNEKKSFCEFLDAVKVPNRYSSNIRNLVSLKDLKLKGLKTHHVLMENFIPVVICGILPDNVRGTFTKLCYFFKCLCSEVISPDKLLRLQS